MVLTRRHFAGNHSCGGTVSRQVYEFAGIAKRHFQERPAGHHAGLRLCFERSLPYCQVQKADMKTDFPADDKDQKKTARIMLQMVAGINHDYVSKIDKPLPVQVECATCH